MNALHAAVQTFPRRQFAIERSAYDVTQIQLPPEYVAMLARDGHDNPPAFAHALEDMFRGIDFTGRRVLEIGSSRGLLAIYMGMRGAQVLSMEPEMAGASSGVIAE